MAISFYILFVLNLGIAIISYFLGPLPEYIQLTMAATLVTLIGIPHGAIDNTLFLKTTQSNETIFYSFYLTLIAIYVLLWVYLPVISMVFFLILSSYHFGQSQLQRYQKIGKRTRNWLYFIWGTAVLSGLIFLQYENITKLMKESNDLMVFESLFTYVYFKVIFYTSLLIFLCLIFVNRKEMKKGNILKELLYLTLILSTFYFQPVLLGFSLYFAATHSLEVMFSEFKFLKQKENSMGALAFIRSLIPFTVLSIVGASILMGMIQLGWLHISHSFLVFIVIASLTLPHSIVMELFYRNLNRKAS